jgi:hypothetical protein
MGAHKTKTAVPARAVGIVGMFADFPATVTMYVNRRLGD